MNPLYQMMGNQGNMPEIVQQFIQFRNGFQGDARGQIQGLLNSGKITQEQYNNAVQIANNLIRYMR